MSQCPKCGKPVFFAERRTSLGKDWHPQCLKCEECDRVLHPGQHSEHRGVPYCSVPCYSLLFGPTMFGHGSPIGAHKSFGRQTDKKDSPKKGPDVMAKLKTYNDFYEGKSGQLSSKEVNGRLVLEGVLRVYWGVEKPIQLKPKDDVPVPRTWRRSYIMAMNNGLDDDLLQKIGVENDPVIRRRRSSLEDLVETLNSGGGERQPKYNTVSFRGERSRRKRFSINGHCYNLETSVFTPAHGTITSVRVTSLTPAPEVIKLLLDKFKVENNPEEFCLNAIRRNGESKVLREQDYPLLERVMMGPMEDEAQIFIMEKSRVQDVSQEVAQYINLPEPVLCGFLEKYKQEEDTEIQKIKQKYEEYRYLLQEQFSSMTTQM